VELTVRHTDSQDVSLRENERFHQLVPEASGSVTLRVFSDTLKNIASGVDFGIEYRSDHREAVAKCPTSASWCPAETSLGGGREGHARPPRGGGNLLAAPLPGTVVPPVRWVQP
jgi:hypothetical protein